MSTMTVPVPGLPKDVGKGIIFTLFYRYGNVPVLFENFVMPEGTSLPEAIAKGREHCLRMSYRFLYVKPFIYDMEAAEQKKHAEA